MTELHNHCDRCGRALRPGDQTFKQGPEQGRRTVCSGCYRPPAIGSFRGRPHDFTVIDEAAADTAQQRAIFSGGMRDVRIQ